MQHQFIQHEQTYCGISRQRFVPRLSLIVHSAIPLERTDAAAAGKICSRTQRQLRQVTLWLANINIVTIYRVLSQDRDGYSSWTKKFNRHVAAKSADTLPSITTLDFQLLTCRGWRIMKSWLPQQPGGIKKFKIHKSNVQRDHAVL